MGKKPDITCYCYANGAIKFRSVRLGLPDGALPIVTGPGKIIRERISGVARHGYDGKTLLVPGVPEAVNQMDAVDALLKWKAWCVPPILAAVRKGLTVDEELAQRNKEVRS